MLEGALSTVVTFLVVLGAAGLANRFFRSVTRLALRAAEANAAAGLADLSARRGDLTGMMERRAAEQRARRERRTSMALSALWLAWLVVPIFAGLAREALPLAAVLWLLPKRPILPAPAPPPADAGAAPPDDALG